MTNTDPKVDWKPIDSNIGHVMRARVVGGWLVRFRHALSEPWTMTFVPDSSGDWKAPAF
jgi:hypothetical protein